ncbi:MAG TPA: hypothetical protein DDY91_11195 [Planctomycetaceae bacterium]|nr:hypothetical protein [Planctomycetaceae bacterium]
MDWSRREFLCRGAVVVWCGTRTVVAQDKPANLLAIVGAWHVSEEAHPVYYYKDADRFVDLFSYHEKDSNDDGIPNVRLRHDERFLIVRSQGYPNHPTAVFPNTGNPNTIRVQDFEFRFPLVPKRAAEITRLPMGPIGMAINGVVFFNPFEQGGMNAVEGYSEVWLDSCCGHPEQRGVYHYHKYPSCVKSPFPDDGEQHSPVLGLAFDGFPIYGPYEGREQLARDLTATGEGPPALDVCNGHEDPVRGYHYHVTPNRFPYILGGYAGVPEISNGRGLRRAGTGVIQNNAEGQSRLPAVIARVVPGTARRGATHTVVFELDPSQVRRRPLPEGAPSWVQVGPWEAKNITREGNRVTCQISIPADASRGQLVDCHIEFGTGANPTVFKKNDAFRVIE